MSEPTNDLLEAQATLAQLSAIRPRLTAADRRFLSSWENYLARTGDGAQIGANRLAILRRVAASYSIVGAAELERMPAAFEVLAADAQGRLNEGEKLNREALNAKLLVKSK